MKNYKQVNEFHCICDEFPSYSGMSNCCGSPVLDDSDICQRCGEHCARICSECEGEGQVLKRYQHPQLINPAYTRCSECRGTGEIE